MYTEKFSIYKQVVVDTYLQKRAKGEDDWLNRPTRYRIRRQCRQIVEHCLEKRDERALHRYLEMDPSNNNYLAAINNTKGDDFKGFEKFLKTPEINTSEENVELLAWLIDFPARPFSQYIKEPQNQLRLIKEEGEDFTPAQQGDTKVPDNAGEGQQTTALIKEVVDVKVQENDTKAATPGGKEKGDPPVKTSDDIDRRWFIGIAVLLIGGITIWRFLPDDKNCMYWNNDHYVATSCDVPRLDTPLVHLDLAKLRGFRRVKHVDTLTHYSVGKLWYVRVADSIEVYSADGKHPLYPDKKLKPLTDYAVNVSQKQHE